MGGSEQGQEAEGCTGLYTMGGGEGDKKGYKEEDNFSSLVIYNKEKCKFT